MTDWTKRTLLPAHPVPPTASTREVVAWVMYLNTRHTDSFYGRTTHRADESELRRYIAKADYHLREVGIWS